MQKKHTRGILAIGIVVLFIGVGIHPALAVNNKQSMVNKVSVEDCGCGEVSDTDLVKVDRLLDRVEVYSKLLLVLSKHNPELREMSKGLSNQLANINKLYDEFNTDILQQIKHPICYILEPLYVIIFIIWAFAYEISYLALLVYNSVLLLIIFVPILIALFPIMSYLVKMIVRYDCEPPVLRTLGDKIPSKTFINSHLIKNIIGEELPIPWINFDWHPAKEPYDIEV